MCSTVKYYLEKSSGLAEHTFQFLFDFAGIKGTRVYELEGKEFAGIYYGNDRQVNTVLQIPFDEGNIIWNELLSNKIKLNEIDNKIPFDIISACSSFITDKVNSSLPNNAFDKHERLLFNSSFQSRNNIGDFPAVNKYAVFFKELIKSKFNVEVKQLWPDGKSCCVVLSHDVDRPVKYQILRNFHFNSNWKIKGRLYHLARYIKNSWKYKFDKSKNDFWLFDNIIEEESKYGFTSTFFFASNNGYSGYGSVNDVFYDISWEEFIRLFKVLRGKKIEVALHASYNAYLDENHFKDERNKLQDISEGDVKGVRHHYWHTGKDIEKTLLKHEKSGFLYDSSIGFNDHAGFRRNIALPFYPFSLKQDRAINCIQFPVTCMDGNLLNKGLGVDEAMEIISNHLDVIKKNEGMGVFNWHSETSIPLNSNYNKWGKTYLKLLEKLSQDSGIWVTSLENVYDWIKQRSVSIK